MLATSRGRTEKRKIGDDAIAEAFAVSYLCARKSSNPMFLLTTASPST